MTSRPRTRVFRPGPVWGCDRLVSRAKVIENQVMAAPVISISSDTSEESVGSHAPRVILFGAIPAIIPVIPEVPIVLADPIVTPEVGAVSVVSPAGVLDLVDYSPSFDSDPSEDSLPPAPDLPLVSPFLCSDDTEADGESEPAEQRPVSSSHDTLAPLSEFPLAPVVAPPRIRRWSAILVRPGEVIPFGRHYRTHLNGPRKLLNARKRVRPISTRKLAWTRVSHHSSDRHSSPDSSSSSALSDHFLSGLTPPDTTDDDSSTPQRFFYRSLARTPQHSSSSERLLDLSQPSSRTSRKRCRSPTASVPSSTYLSRSIAPTPVDLLPPHKSAADTREIVVDPLVIGDSFESFRGGIPDLEDTIYDIVHYMLEVRIDRITEIKTTQRQLKTSQMVASGERASLVERIGSLRLEYLKNDSDSGMEMAGMEMVRMDFMKCQPLNFKGTKGVFGLIRWFEKMETVFHISNCLEKSQVKYATCTLLNSTLTWWNSHKRTIGTEAAFAMSWRELMKLMTEISKVDYVMVQPDGSRGGRIGLRNSLEDSPINIKGMLIATENLTKTARCHFELAKQLNGPKVGRDCCEKMLNLQTEVGDSQLTGPQIIHKTTEKIIQIQNKMQTARDQQKSYADVRHRPLEFQVGDKVMLKVSPWKGVIRFGKRGKLNPRYIGPFKVLAKKCLSDESLVIPLEEIQIDDKLHFIEEPVEIMDREVKQLKQSRIPTIKEVIPRVTKNVFERVPALD
ncbi:hypothetical protein Tco_1104167 [Tanacetum coccineum]